MSDDDSRTAAIESIQQDLERVHAFLERAEQTQQAALEQLEAYQDRYDEDNYPMPPDESDFTEAPKDD